MIPAGKELLARSGTLACAEGADLLWLTAWTGNAPALRFYKAQPKGCQVILAGGWWTSSSSHGSVLGVELEQSL